MNRHPWERDSRGDSSRKLSPAEWQLLYSICYDENGVAKPPRGARTRALRLFGVSHEALAQYRRKLLRWRTFGSLRPKPIDLSAAISTRPSENESKENDRNDL